MLGHFQQSHLRVEVDASTEVLRKSLLLPEQFKRWLWYQRFSSGLPEQIHVGLTYTSWVGPIAIEHKVATVEADRLQLLLSQGIDGFHEWRWGEGWVQSRLEGVSLLPLNLGQTFSLANLRQFLTLTSQP